MDVFALVSVNKLIPVNNRQIFRLLWPILIEQALSSFVGLADMIVVSHVGDAAVSAVGLVDSVNILLINVFSAIAAGATVIVSQRAGQNDREGIFKTIGQASFVIVCIMLTVSALAMTFSTNIFDALYPGVASDVRANGLIYFRITAFNYALIALYATLAGSMRGQGDVRTPMRVALMINVINVTLNVVFTYVFHMGVAGIAFATMIGWASGALVMVSLTIRRNTRRIFSFSNIRPQKNILFPVFRIGLPSGLDSLLFHCGKIITQVFLSGMGTHNIAGMVIAGSMFGLFCIPGNSFAIAVTTLVGQNYGAGLYRTARRMLLRCIVLATALMSVISLGAYWVVPFLVSLYKPTASAAPVAIQILRLYLVMIPLFWPVAFITSNGLRAVSDVVYSTTVSVSSMWTMRVGCAWVLGVYFNLGPFGIALAMGLDWIVRGMFYIPRILTLKRLKEDQPDKKPTFAHDMEEIEVPAH
jgi:putative MATE family efflux protein